MDEYQNQKNIRVISSQSDAGRLTHDLNKHLAAGRQAVGQDSFFRLRLKYSLGLAAKSAPSYYPGALIPGPGGPACHEIDRGNLLFDQFLFLLQFDDALAERLCNQTQLECKNRRTTKATGRKLTTRKVPPGDPWLWPLIEEPGLRFVDDGCAVLPVVSHAVPAGDRHLAVDNLSARTAYLFDLSRQSKFTVGSVEELLATIADAWFIPAGGHHRWSLEALSGARTALIQYEPAVTKKNLLPFLFELEAMASQASFCHNRTSIAQGIFGENFIDVWQAPVAKLGGTELCLPERLFDELINLSGRGFAPVIINEYWLVADGNHRLTASHIWNILKYAEHLEWCLDNIEFQRRVTGFAAALEDGLLGQPAGIRPVSLHQALSHLSHFLCRPEWRSRLLSYTRPQIRRHKFIAELPVVCLPEYLSGAVVKSLYDEGLALRRACPSLYETMAQDQNLVLPPRASYHFTDAALLPWFTVLRAECSSFRHRKTAPAKHGKNGSAATSIRRS
jgi:hypothetical protein